MKIPLYIERSIDQCGDSCPFLQEKIYSRSADCNLFNERLHEDFRDNYFVPCSQCDSIYQNTGEE